MGERPADGARRLVVAGDRGGEVIVIPPRVSLVGRDETADIRLPYQGVSRRHLVIDATGPAVVVVDQQSRNGTWVNGRRLEGPSVLRSGDRVTVGTVQLQYEVGEPGSPGAGGPRRAQPGSGDVYASTRDQFIAAGNQTWNQTIHVRADDDPSDEIFQGRGPGRVIAIIGMIVSLGGFGWAAFTLFSTAAYDGPGIPEFPVQFGYAFGLFALGGLIASVGTGISRAQRRRQQERG
ncbi:FHA domain-containing protein [Agromyces binzhouensis]|uniref:FHA domain-containing protein n=1 Tax=Agromyces binzhouensis TaxID=1817495 RepID=UPI003633AB7E